MSYRDVPGSFLVEPRFSSELEGKATYVSKGKSY